MIKTFLYTLAFIMIVAAIFRVSPLYDIYFEKNAPIIVLGELPPGLGLKPETISVTVMDPGAGLDELVVRIRQRAQSAEMLRIPLKGASEYVLPLELDHLPFVLEDGRVDFEVEVFDRSYFSNRSMKEFMLIADRNPPAIEAVTTQHNVRQGGSQLVVYRARDKHLLKSGVLVKDLFFEGVKDSECSQELPQGRDLYCVLYSVPMNMSVSNDDVKLVAYDSAGNESKASFYNRISRRAPRITNTSVPGTFLERVGDTLSDEAVTEANNKIPSNPLPIQLSTKAFKKVDGTIISSFGDTIRYMSNGAIKAQRLNLGYEFTGLTDVRAMAAGQISFVGDAGPLGKIVAIDHGLNLRTIYGFMGEMTVHMNQSVEQGQILGTAGESGIARMPGTYLEVLIGNVPVDANEWWTESWYSTHIIDKLKESVELATLLSVH